MLSSVQWIAVGNVIGSNVLNLLCVLGGAALLAPARIEIRPQALAWFALPFTAVTLVVGSWRWWRRPRTER